jgi:hypothetical protein
VVVAVVDDRAGRAAVAAVDTRAAGEKPC